MNKMYYKKSQNSQQELQHGEYKQTYSLIFL